MSIRSEQSTDNLLHADAWSAGTGLFAIGFWVKLITDRNTFTDLVGFGDAALDPAGGSTFSIATQEDGTQLAVFYPGGAGVLNGPSLTVGTWFWVVVGRDGSNNLTIRLFDDSAGTTPVGTASDTVANDFNEAFDNLVIGRLFTGEHADAEFTNIKVHNGAYWSDAQCRTESQNYDIQTAGGTPWASYRTTDIDADVDGINDGTGNGRHLTNTGFVNGASDPTQLVSAGLSADLPLVNAAATAQTPLTSTQTPLPLVSVTAAAQPLLLSVLAPLPVASAAATAETLTPSTATETQVSLPLASAQAQAQDIQSTFLIPLPMVTASAIPQTLTPSNAAIVINLPLVSVTADPGTAIGHAQQIAELSVTAAAQPLIATIQTLVPLPTVSAAADAQPLGAGLAPLTGELPLVSVSVVPVALVPLVSTPTVELPVVSVSATALTFGVSVQTPPAVTLPVAAANAQAQGLPIASNLLLPVADAAAFAQMFGVPIEPSERRIIRLRMLQRL